MENLNAEQVKSDLAICALGDCQACHYNKFIAGCRDELCGDALALITSQEQRIGELTEENERLRAENDELCDNIACLEIDKENAERRTVRKMQERLDKRFCHDPAFLGVEQRLIMEVIDQIAKEMLEGQK
jgi:hypothetical protein